MEVTLNSKASQGIVLGLVFQFIGWFMNTHSTSRAIAVGGLIGGILGTVMLVHGCMIFAEHKGKSKWLGLLGLLSGIGLLGLWFITKPAKVGER